MSTRCKFFGLTSAQAEILKTLFELEEQTKKGRYWKAKELGAYRCSHHALTLRKLYEQGLVERDESQSTFGYRIAKAGQSLWHVLSAAAEMPISAIFGGQAAEPRARAMNKVAAA